MAYVPPHKRQSNESLRPCPVPETLNPRFQRNLNLRASANKADRRGKFTYSENAISRWFLMGSKEGGEIPPHVRLEPVSAESVRGRTEEKSLVLVNPQLSRESNEAGGSEGSIPQSPGVLIAAKVEKDILSALEMVKSGIVSQNLEEVKPTLVVRFGKIHFQRSPSMSLDNIKGSQFRESTLEKLRKSFYTTVSSSFANYVTDKVVPAIGVEFEEEKGVYHVKLSDKERPDATISCKCAVNEGKRLNMYKAGLNQVRHLVIDISCLHKIHDLRLMVYSKRILTALSDDETEKLKELIDSAVLDSDVKGGLRWPLGKASSGDRYRVCGVWHTEASAYSSPTMRLKVRHADRYDFRTATGEAGTEVILKLKRVVAKLLEPEVEEDTISDMLRDELRMIWDHFLCSSEPVT